MPLACPGWEIPDEDDESIKEDEEVEDDEAIKNPVEEEVMMGGRGEGRGTTMGTGKVADVLRGIATET